MNKTDERNETPAEHVANALTHGVGFGLSIACLVLLVVFAALNRGVWELVSCSVYGATLVILYLASVCLGGQSVSFFRHSVFCGDLMIKGDLRGKKYRSKCAHGND